MTDRADEAMAIAHVVQRYIHEFYGTNDVPGVLNLAAVIEPAVVDALPQTGDAAEVEVREVWALRWSDGEISGGTYSDDGSDYAEQMVRSVAGDSEVVHRTETITRTPWEMDNQ